MGKKLMLDAGWHCNEPWTLLEITLLQYYDYDNAMLLFQVVVGKFAIGLWLEHYRRSWRLD